MIFSNTPLHPLFKRAGVLGLGLVGGSWARALKGLGAHVTALDPDADACAAALEAGAVDGVGDSPSCFNGCGLLVLAAPPAAVCEILPRLAGLDIGLVTDVCSVKTPVMEAARGMKNFIGGHPMAGSEKTGFAASRANLFENMPYALCVASGCDLPQERVAAFENLLASIGAKVVRMTAEEHDAAVARVSHLPHAAAFALRRVAEAQPECLKLAGRGYADTTRIAHAPEKLWAEIFATSPQMLPVLREYIADLSAMADGLSKKRSVDIPVCDVGHACVADRNVYAPLTTQCVADKNVYAPLKTKRFGLVGHPLGHSLSPFIHGRIMEKAGVNGTYELFDIEPSRLRGEVPRLMRELDGFNCTIPHKETLAEILGSPFPVNTVFQGKGFNTDFAGFATCGFDFQNKDVLLLGAGGTARMMMEACLNAGAKSITVCARKPFQHPDPRVRAAFMECGDVSPLSMDNEKAATRRRTPHVILNATPLGMWPRAWEMPIKWGEHLAPCADDTGAGCSHYFDDTGAGCSHYFFDAVYNPTPTRLVLNARKHGCRAVGGLRMLARQAIEAQKIWNPGVAFDTDAIEAAILPELSRELLRHSPMHLLLTGFMGAGKSTVGKMLAAELGTAFTDIDAEIEKETGRSIADIFARDGEAAFRGIEREVATRALKQNTSSVVASGGGLPVSMENQALIRETNTLVLHLDAPFEILWQRASRATNARPLLQNPAQARALFDARQPVYRAFCDFIFDARKPPSQLAADIAAQLTQMEN